MIGSDAYCMIRRPVVISPVNPIFAMRGLPARAFPISPPGPVTTLTTAGGGKLPISSISTSRLSGVLEAGFDYNAISGHDLGCELPRGDEQREIPGDDLADDAERFLK